VGGRLVTHGSPTVLCGRHDHLAVDDRAMAPMCSARDPPGQPRERRPVHVRCMASAARAIIAYRTGKRDTATAGRSPWMPLVNRLAHPSETTHDPLPVPVPVSRGSTVSGSHLKSEALNADLSWVLGENGEWTFNHSQPRSQYHLYCSERSDHAGG
jgi:hypothetical protein